MALKPPYSKAMQAALAALEQISTTAHIVVPRDPTPRMLDAAAQVAALSRRQLAEIYLAMTNATDDNTQQVSRMLAQILCESDRTKHH